MIHRLSLQVTRNKSQQDMLPDLTVNPVLALTTEGARLRRLSQSRSDWDLRRSGRGCGNSRQAECFLISLDASIPPPPAAGERHR